MKTPAQIRRYCQQRVDALHEEFVALIREAPNTREQDISRVENLAKQIAYQDVVEFIRSKS